MPRKLYYAVLAHVRQRSTVKQAAPTNTLICAVKSLSLAAEIPPPSDKNTYLISAAVTTVGPNTASWLTPVMYSRVRPGNAAITFAQGFFYVADVAHDPDAFLAPDAVFLH